jgi:hypothetical protein
MRLRNTLAALLLPVLALFVWSVKPAEALSTHKISYSGAMDLRADRPLGPDLEQRFAFQDSWTLPLAPTNKYWMRVDKCIGNEVRGLLSIEVTLNNGTVSIKPILSLWRGTSCRESDQKYVGITPGESVTLNRGEVQEWTLKASNQLSPGRTDSVRVEFTATHF